MLSPLIWLIRAKANVLLFRSEGASVGVVGPDNKVEIRQITIGHDLGSKLEIIEGLKPDDRVIINLSDSLTNCLVVEVAKDSTAKKNPAP